MQVVVEEADDEDMDDDTNVHSNKRRRSALMPIKKDRAEEGYVPLPP